MFTGVSCQSKPGRFTCDFCPAGMKGKGTSCTGKICLLEYSVSLNLVGLPVGNVLQELRVTEHLVKVRLILEYPVNLNLE